MTALEANLRSPRTLRLRITPPFSGRMRARIHEVGTGEFVGEGDPVHLDPRDLVTDVPRYPEPADTEDEIRTADDVEYTPERHRERHVEAVEAWRESITIADTVEIPEDGEGHAVDVKVLG